MANTIRNALAIQPVGVGHNALEIQADNAAVVPRATPGRKRIFIPKQVAYAAFCCGAFNCLSFLMLRILMTYAQRGEYLSRITNSAETYESHKAATAMMLAGCAPIVLGLSGMVAKIEQKRGVKWADKIDLGRVGDMSDQSLVNKIARYTEHGISFSIAEIGAPLVPVLANFLLLYVTGQPPKLWQASIAHFLGGMAGGTAKELTRQLHQHRFKVDRVELPRIHIDKAPERVNKTLHGLFNERSMICFASLALMGLTLGAHMLTSTARATQGGSFTGLHGGDPSKAPEEYSKYVPILYSIAIPAAEVVSRLIEGLDQWVGTRVSSHIRTPIRAAAVALLALAPLAFSLKQAILARDRDSIIGCSSGIAGAVFGSGGISYNALRRRDAKIVELEQPQPNPAEPLPV